MILTCPACSTQYVVKDGAIPEGGRQVRCAACKHSWHQDPETLEPGDAVTEEEADTAAQEDSIAGGDAGYGAAESEADSAETEDEALEPAGYSTVDPIASPEDPLIEAEDPEPLPVDKDGGAEDPGAEPDEWRPPARDDEFSPFADRAVPVEQGRSPLRGLLIAILVLAVLGAAFWFLAPPEWKARVGLAEAAETPLQLMMTHSDRQRLASGNELLAVQGRVINPTDERQPVPPIQAQLRSSSGELVYSWTIAPPASELGPGASATFNSAEVNVPAGGDELTISLGTPRA